MTNNFSFLFSIFLPNCSGRKEGRMNWAVYICNPSPGEVEAEDPIQDHPQPQGSSWSAWET